MSNIKYIVTFGLTGLTDTVITEKKAYMTITDEIIIPDNPTLRELFDTILSIMMPQTMITVTRPHELSEVIADSYKIGTLYDIPVSEKEGLNYYNPMSKEICTFNKREDAMSFIERVHISEVYKESDYRE